MTRTATADLRWLRALLVTLVATTLGVAAHSLAGGLLPGPAVLVVLGCALLVVAAACLGTPASYGMLVALVGGGQLLVHLVLTASAGHGDPVAGHGAPLTATGASAAPHWVEHLRADLTGPHLAMAIAHLAAAAGVAAWLLRGERALWTLVALLGACAASVVAALGGRVAAPRTRRPSRPEARLAAVARHDVRRLRDLVAHGSSGRRGPPVLPA
ncbi:MAG: hypothetical protein CMJ44_14195 [Pimelobacter sp.]|nr:hypothetical protein [Pimelobacter sp.]